MRVSEKHYLMVGDDLYDAATNDPVLRAAVESRTVSQSLVCSSEVLNDPQVEAQTEARTMPMVATSCGLLLEVDRGGIEPPTPGFSDGLSSALDSLLTSDKLSGCDSSGNGHETRAQQKAQHEDRNSALNDWRLARLIEVWPMLSEETRDAIARLVGDDSHDVDDVTVAPAGEAGAR